MILRGAVLSEGRRAIERESPRVSPSLLRESAPLIEPTVEPTIVERVVAAPLTHEAVVEWLEREDARARIVEYLAHDLTELRSAARAEGFAAGKKEGLASAQAQAQTVIESLQAAVSQAEAAFAVEIEELSGLCAEVVCEALAKIAGPVLSMREAALGTVLEVLKRVKDERDLVIRVSEHDLPALREAEQEIERACAGRQFTLVADSRVSAGGCIVESSLGSLDGRFDVQLRALADTLRAAKAAAAESR